VYVAEAAMFMAAKFDESSFSVGFADFHASILELPSFAALLSSLDLSAKSI
jgi:hypothetical protein